MKKVLVALVLSFSTFLAFGITPVFAETHVIYVDPKGAGAFNYFINYGFNPSIESYSSTVTYNLSTINSELGYDNPVYRVECNSEPISVSTGQFDYSCYAYSANGSQISLGHTYYFTGNVKGTTTESHFYKYNIPWMKQTSTYTRPTGFDWNKSFALLANNYVYLSFYSSSPLWDASNNSKYYGILANVWTNRGNDNDIVFERMAFDNIAGSYFYTLRFYNKSNSDLFMCLDFGPNLGNVMPIYLGSGQNLSNDEKSEYGIETSTDKLLKQLVNGSTQSQSIINNSNSTNQQYENINNQIDNLESQVNADFNNRIDNIPTSSSLLSLPKLVASANWVRERFNEINIAPFSVMLEFSLILGIALIFLGKIR